MFWYTKHKKKKADEQEKNLERIKSEFNQAELDVAKARAEMLKKSCPFREEGDYCYSNCVHFKEGSVGHYQLNYPKCRLWGEK